MSLSICPVLCLFGDILGVSWHQVPGESECAPEHLSAIMGGTYSTLTRYFQLAWVLFFKPLQNSGFLPYGKGEGLGGAWEVDSSRAHQGALGWTQNRKLKCRPGKPNLPKVGWQPQLFGLFIGSLSRLAWTSPAEAPPGFKL